MGRSSSGSVDRDEAYQRIYALVDSIPPGRVASYGQVARESGLPRHARLVGRALANLPAGSDLPWHRVVNAAGRISPRPGAAVSRQRRLLRAEGVRVGEGDRIDLRAFGWSPAFDEQGSAAPEPGARRNTRRRARAKRRGDP